MCIRDSMGADKEGNIRAIDLYTLSNTGAYGEHGPTTVGLSGHKAIPLYGSLDAYRFRYDVVYTCLLYTSINLVAHLKIPLINQGSICGFFRDL